MPPLAPTQTARAWACALGTASVLYLLASLLALWLIVPAPAHLLAGLTSGPRNLDRTDQQMVLATVVGNARRLVERPSVLRDEGQCFPLPKAYALGEHMFGEGLMAAPAWILTGDPVLSFNSMLLLRLWIPAMAMFAFVYHVTRNPGAAFLAGLLYGVHHYRVTDPVHSFVHGELWLPLGLLCVHRLFEGGGWRPVVGLALAVSLSVLESLYPLLVVVIVLTVYTLFLVAKFPARLPHAVPRIAAALVLPVGVAWWVFAPYLSLKDGWGVLQGVAPMFALAGDYLPRGPYFPGAVLLVLAVVGLADRARGARNTVAGDPRVAVAVAGFLCFWSSVYGLRIPFTAIRFPSPLFIMIGIVPGLDSARSLVLVKIGIVSSLAVLAGYGMLAVLERLGARTGTAAVAILSMLALGETLHPSVQPLVYGHVPQFEAYEGGLDGIYRDFVERVDAPVLDVPMRPGELLSQAHYLQWASYHGGSTAACYNSFPSPVQAATAEIAARLPDPRAARALAAIGFSSVVLHGEQLDDDVQAATLARFEAGSTGSFDNVARAGHHLVFRLASPEDVDDSFGALATAGPRAPAEEIRVSGPVAEIPLTFAARAGSTYRHPTPIERTALEAVWRRDGSGESHREAFRGLLPLAIAAGDQTVRRLGVPVGVEPGTYTLLVFRSEEPDRALAIARIHVLIEPG